MPIIVLTILVTYVTASPVDFGLVGLEANKLIYMYNDDIEDLFRSFKTDYGKTYRDKLEEARRKTIFEENVDYINAHNQRYLSGQTSFYLGINTFADMTLKEIRALSPGPVAASQTGTGAIKPIPLHYLPIIYPDAVDWRKKGYVGPVRTQGACASDWAMSAAEAIEGQVYRYNNKLTPLSAQQIMDCSSAYHTYGCNGGLVTDAYRYISAVNGIESEKDYPYEAKVDQCKFNSSLVKADVYGWTEIKRGDEDTLQQAVAMDGPVSVWIDSSHQSFQFYSGGIYDEPNCSNVTLCHAVLAVGYNTNPDYWIVKNSWGASWGDHGYIKMSRNKHNQCGIASNATFPIV